MLFVRDDQRVHADNGAYGRGYSRICVSKHQHRQLAALANALFDDYMHNMQVVFYCHSAVGRIIKIICGAPFSVYIITRRHTIDKVIVILRPW